MDGTVKKYLAEIGRKGGKKSKRKLTSLEATAMAGVRWKRWRAIPKQQANNKRTAKGGVGELKQLSRQWNRIDQELETLWQDNDNPRGKAWEKLAAPLFSEQTRVENDLAPLLLEWAEKNGCGKYGRSILGFELWSPKKDCYKNIVEHTGLKASPRRIRELLLSGGWLVRGSKVYEQKRKNMDAFVRSMSDAKFDEYMEDFCTASLEGKNTKKMFLELRAKFKAEQK